MFFQKYLFAARRGQGPIDKIGKTARLPVKEYSTVFSLPTLQLSNFGAQALKCMNRDFICSSKANLHDEAIISKIRRWHIDLCDNEKPVPRLVSLELPW